jgi:hypothetical protein
MTKQEALKVLCDSCQFSNYETVQALHEDTDTMVTISKFDIIVNLECNDYELDLDFIQDFSEENGDIFQGHSLSELFLI